MQYKLIFQLIFVLSFFNISAIKIDRVILATNNNPDYIQFWPIVAKTWKEIIGVKPTLALISDENIEIDESLGEVLRFKTIPGVSTALHAQTIRLLLPAYYENEVCIISDIDMIPLSKKYFTDDIKDLPDDAFIVFKNGYYEANIYHFKYPMCYNASKGKNFKEIFKIKNVNEIESIIKKWNSLNLGWGTDETILFKYLNNWKHYKTKCIKLGHFDDKRINRTNWNYEEQKVKEGYYDDAHCPRPYIQYKEIIDYLFNLLEEQKNEPLK